MHGVRTNDDEQTMKSQIANNHPSNYPQFCLALLSAARLYPEQYSELNSIKVLIEV